MPYLSYLAFDIFGAIFWVGAMILGGYSLGRSIPNIGERIHYVIAVVIVVSVLPAVISIYRARHKFTATDGRGSAPTTRPEGE
jgi:membrane-associated protein